MRVDSWPSWWQPMQPLFFMSVEPVGMLDIRGALLAAELLRLRDLHHRVPVDRGVVLRRGRFVGAGTAVKLSCLPGSLFTFGESTRP